MGMERHTSWNYRMDNSAVMPMKDVLIIFSVGLMTITLTITAINGMKELNKKPTKQAHSPVCKEGGLPDYRCVK